MFGGYLAGAAMMLVAVLWAIAADASHSARWPVPSRPVTDGRNLIDGMQFPAPRRGAVPDRWTAAYGLRLYRGRRP